VEKRVKDPVVSLDLFKNRLFSSSMAISFFYGAIMISSATYIPLFIQGVFGGSATSAGLVLTPMMLGVVASSTLGGRLIGKTSYRNIMLVSIVLIAISMILLGTISIDTPRYLITMYTILMGLGIGSSFPVISLSSLHNLPFSKRGSATSMNSFFRTIGSTLGVTIFGVIQTHQLKVGLQGTVPVQFEGQVGDGRGLLTEAVKKMIPADLYHKMMSVLADSIAFVYQWSIVVAGLALIFIVLMGNLKLEIPTKGQGQPSGEGHPSGNGAAGH
jgi:MFS family permease